MMISALMPVTYRFKIFTNDNILHRFGKLVIHGIPVATNNK